MFAFSLFWACGEHSYAPFLPRMFGDLIVSSLFVHLQLEPLIIRSSCWVASVLPISALHTSGWFRFSVVLVAARLFSAGGGSWAGAASRWDVLIAGADSAQLAANGAVPAAPAPAPAPWPVGPERGLLIAGGLRLRWPRPFCCCVRGFSVPHSLTYRTETGTAERHRRTRPQTGTAGSCHTGQC